MRSRECVIGLMIALVLSASCAAQSAARGDDAGPDPRELRQRAAELVREADALQGRGNWQGARESAQRAADLNAQADRVDAARARQLESWRQSTERIERRVQDVVRRAEEAGLEDAAVRLRRGLDEIGQLRVRAGEAQREHEKPPETDRRDDAEAKEEARLRLVRLTRAMHEGARELIKYAEEVEQRLVSDSRPSQEQPTERAEREQPAQSRLAHLRQAVEHLRLAGLAELAQRVARAGEDQIKGEEAEKPKKSVVIVRPPLERASEEAREISSELERLRHRGRMMEEERSAPAPARRRTPRR